MHKNIFDPDRCFLINTDLDSYRRDYPIDDGRTPFAYWLNEGFAYLTPSPTVDSYDAALQELQVGDTIFAYENRAGIVAMGTVLERPDLTSHFGITRVYPNAQEAVKRIRMAWDTSINCTLATIIAAGTTPRGGQIPLWRVKSTVMRNLLADLVARR